LVSAFRPHPTVLDYYEDVGLTLNLCKCEFAKPEIKFVGSGGRRPDLQGLEALEKLERPHTETSENFLVHLDITEIMCSFSDIVKPLTDLTSKKIPHAIPWEECHQQAYEDFLQG